VTAEILRRALADRRRSLLAWCAGVVVYIAVIAAVFPSIRGSHQFDQLIKSYPDVLKAMFGIAGSFSITSGAGFVDTELFSFMIPLFVLVVAISAGAGLLAGEEERGLLDLVLSYPVERSRLVLAKAAALAIEVVALLLAMTAALAVCDPLVGFDLVSQRLLGGMVAVGLVGIFHGFMALAVGAATRHRASAIGVPAALAAIGYLVGSLYTLAAWLDPFRYLSSFYYGGSAPLQRGVDWVHLLVLALAAVLLLAAAVAVFERRDVSGA
jgi:ABC-2 type transport system permease protein